MSTSFARRLATHCPTGPVLDLLLRSSGSLPAELSGTPSEDLAWKLYRGASAGDAKTLVESATSPDLLRRVHARERRVGVRRVLAANPHVPDDVFEELVSSALRESDREMAVNLLDATAPEDRIPLLTRPGFTYLVGNSYAEANAVVAMDASVRDELALEQVPLLGPSARWRLLTNRAVVEALQPDTLVDLLKGLEPDARSGPEGLVRDLLERTPEVDEGRVAMRLCEALPLAGVLIAVAARVPALSLDLSSLLDLAPTREVRERVWAAALGAGAELGTELLEEFLEEDPPLSDSQRARLRCTPEVRAALLRRGSLALQASLLAEASPEDCVEALLAEPLLRTAFRCDGERLEALHLAGLPGEILVELLRTGTRGGYNRAGLLRSRITPLVREHLVATGPVNLVSDLEVTPAEAEVLLTRSDVREDPDVLLWAMQTAGVLEDDLRRELLTRLTSAQLIGVLSAGRKSMAPRVGDLTWILTTSHAAEVAAALSQSAASWGVDGVWLGEAVRLLPLPWSQLTGKRVLAELTGALLELLGEDEKLWHTALALLPEWEGTLAELVETLDQLD